jgi:hypothetical protein
MAGCAGVAEGTQPGEDVAGEVYGTPGATLGGAGKPGTLVVPGATMVVGG